MTLAPLQGEYGKVYFKGDRVIKVGVSSVHEYQVAAVLQRMLPVKYRRFFVKPLAVNAEKETFVMEKIEAAGSLSDMLDEMTRGQVDAVFRMIVKILCTAYDAVEFTHNDLHLNNILVLKTDRSHAIGLETRGYLPVIIDYGFSHCAGVDGCGTQLHLTNRGTNPAVGNPNTDLSYLAYGLWMDGFRTDLLRRAVSMARSRRMCDRGELAHRHSFFDILAAECRCSSYDRTCDSADPPSKSRREARDERRLPDEPRMRREAALERLLLQCAGSEPRQTEPLADLFERYARDGGGADELKSALRLWYLAFVDYCRRHNSVYDPPLAWKRLLINGKREFSQRGETGDGRVRQRRHSGVSGH